MLRPRKKITRKEIKKDPLLEFMAKAEKWYSANQKYLFYGISGVLVAVVLTLLIVNSRSSANRKASGDLGIAMQYLDSGQQDEALNKLLQLKDTYSGTHAADLATYFIGKIYLDKNDFENARVYLEEAQKELKRYDLLYPGICADLALCKEKARDFTGAAQLYEKAAEATKVQFLKEEFLLNAVGNYIRSSEYQNARSILSGIDKDKMDFQLKNSYDYYSSILQVKGS